MLIAIIDWLFFVLESLSIILVSTMNKGIDFVLANFKILFLDSNTEWFKDIPMEYNLYNEAAREFTINKNMLIIFPSSMRHQILPNASKKDRYSIAFNIMPQGKLNYPGDSQIDLTIN